MKPYESVDCIKLAKSHYFSKQGFIKSPVEKLICLIYGFNEFKVQLVSMNLMNFNKHACNEKEKRSLIVSN